MGGVAGGVGGDASDVGRLSLKMESKQRRGAAVSTWGEDGWHCSKSSFWTSHTVFFFFFFIRHHSNVYLSGASTASAQEASSTSSQILTPWHSVPDVKTYYKKYYYGHDRYICCHVVCSSVGTSRAVARTCRPKGRAGFYYIKLNFMKYMSWFVCF